MKNNFKNKILEEFKDSITRDFKEKTEEMRKHMNKLKDESKDLRNRSMRTTLIFRGVPENKQIWEDNSRHLVSLLLSRLNLNYYEFGL